MIELSGKKKQQDRPSVKNVLGWSEEQQGVSRDDEYYRWKEQKEVIVTEIARARSSRAIEAII